MALPYFFIADISTNAIILEEDTSKHIISVLRMRQGEQLLLTDGKGAKATATITDDNRKRCEVQILNRNTEPQVTPKVSIGISLTKNASRFEWFLEKATEIGVAEIIPLLCDRTEKEKFRHDRLHGIIISAMLQSQQCWMPQLSQPLSFKNVLERTAEEQRFIAHCLPEQKVQLSTINRPASSLILIGPEGDFTEDEIEAALGKGFQPVALGNTRLRTETAGIVAATLLCNGV